MARHRSHATSKYSSAHHTDGRTSKAIPSRPSLYAEAKKYSVPPFLAWPSYLLEKMMAPWRSNIMSVVSQADSWRVGSRITVPKSSSKESDTEYHYLIELPGITREEITLNFHNGALMLRVETQGKGLQWSSHSIRRAFTLPVYSNSEAITAELRNGLLTIAVPKTDKPASSKPRTIEIL